MFLSYSTKNFNEWTMNMYGGAYFCTLTNVALFASNIYVAAEN